MTDANPQASAPPRVPPGNVPPGDAPRVGQFELWRILVSTTLVALACVSVIHLSDYGFDERITRVGITVALVLVALAILFRQGLMMAVLLLQGEGVGIFVLGLVTVAVLMRNWNFLGGIGTGVAMLSLMLALVVVLGGILAAALERRWRSVAKLLAIEVGLAAVFLSTASHFLN